MSVYDKRVHFFIWFCAIFPLVDVLNGACIYYGIGVPVGIAYRMVFLLVVLLFIFLKGIDPGAYSVFLVLSMLCIVFSFSIQAAYFQDSLSMIFSEISVLIKVLMWIVVAYFIKLYKKYFKLAQLENLFFAISVFFVLGLLVPYILKIGDYTYDGTAGFKGFYVGPNDTAFAFIVLTIFIAWYLSSHLTKIPIGKLIFVFVLFGLNILCLFLLGTKTGILCGFLVTIYFFVDVLFLRHKVGVIPRFLVLQAGVLGFGYLVLRGKYLYEKMLMPPIRRFVYFYYLYQGDLTRLITSSRSVYLTASFRDFKETKNNFFIFLFGYGFENRIVFFKREGLIEMDFFDAFFSFGIIGIIVLVGHLIYYSKVAFQYKKMTIYSFLFVLSIVFGFFAGHVFFSALASTLLGLICGGMVLLVDQQKANKEEEKA